MSDELFLGEHYIAEFFDCEFERLNDPEAIQKAFLHCAQVCNATIICSKFHKFNPFGVSGVVVIAESHLTIHTWPEYKYAAIDVFTCSTKMRSGKCVEILSESFKCLNYQSSYIPRGYVKNLHLSKQEFQKERENYISPSNLEQANKEKMVQESYIYEQGVYSRFGIPYEKILYNQKSKYQDVKIVESSTMGRTLLLDGVFMICQKTEANYHQMMVHPVIQILLQKGKKSLNVLIIGGGDGGAARELLRYPQVQKVKVCQLDGDVIESCRKYIPQTAKAYDDPKVEIFVSDGLAYVGETEDKWDLILCDGCDPIGEACNLFSNSFYKNCHRILNDDGIFLTQGESIHAYQDQFIRTAKALKEVFGEGNSSLLFYHQPIYEFGMWSFQMAIKSDKHPCDLKQFSRKELNQQNIEKFAEEQGLQYYNYDMHVSSFAIPNQYRKVLKEI